MKKTTKRPSAPECTQQLTMVVDPAKLDTRQIAVTRKRLLAVGVRLRLVTRDGYSLDEAIRG